MLYAHETKFSLNNSYPDSCILFDMHFIAYRFVVNTALLPTSFLQDPTPGSHGQGFGDLSLLQMLNI